MSWCRNTCLYSSYRLLIFVCINVYTYIAVCKNEDSSIIPVSHRWIQAPLPPHRPRVAWTFHHPLPSRYMYMYNMCSAWGCRVESRCFQDFSPPLHTTQSHLHRNTLPDGLLVSWCLQYLPVFLPSIDFSVYKCIHIYCCV